MTQIDYGLKINRVTLRVNDLDAVAGFYKATVGLSLLYQDGETALLGAGDTALLELQRDVHATWQPNAPGLYHTAFLLPQRSDLGAWLATAAKHNVIADGASNHGVSEAIYLTDPEGNGVEIYADRPRDQWSKGSGSRPIDFDDLMARATHWNGMPSGTSIGHVHLQVGNLGAADDVLVGALGLDVMRSMPGMRFYAAGGYHHHFGANTQRSRGINKPDGTATGLVSVDLEIATGADFPEYVDAEWGTRFSLSKREALAA